MRDDFLLAGLMLLGGSVLAVIVISILIVGSVLLPGDNDFDKAFEDLKEQGIIVKMCSTPLSEPSNETCTFKLQPFSGFWINDIYNTCTYFAPDGNIMFEGYCYKCKQLQDTAKVKE